MIRPYIREEYIWKYSYIQGTGDGCGFICNLRQLPDFIEISASLNPTFNFDQSVACHYVACV